MGANSRAKGGRGEREVGALLLDLLGVRLVRRLSQARDAGHDLELAEGDDSPAGREIARYAIEVKLYSAVTPGLVRSWWAQAYRQADSAGLVPCLAYRGNRALWRFVVPIQAISQAMPAPLPESTALCADLSAEGFAALIRESISV